MPTAQLLIDYYATFYTAGTSPSGGPHNVATENPERAARHMAKMISPILHKSKGKVPTSEIIRVLDYGGGDGTLSVLLVRELIRRKICSSAEVTVVDLSDGFTKLSLDKTQVTKFPSLDLVGSELGYDVVVASAVLEHIPNFRPILESLVDRLQPGGLMYLRTPWSSALATTLSHVGVGYDMSFPEHVHDMGGDFWKKAAGSLNGRDVRVMISRPSFVSTSLAKSPFMTIVAALLKAPSYVLGPRWPYVGGWEVLWCRK